MLAGLPVSAAPYPQSNAAVAVTAAEDAEVVTVDPNEQRLTDGIGAITRY
jgi:hypothetical protein